MYRIGAAVFFLHTIGFNLSRKNRKAGFIFRNVVAGVHINSAYFHFFSRPNNVD